MDGRERFYSEAQAAAMLPGAPSAATLKRWRLAGKVPFTRTPGGRIFYTFAQLATAGAAMKCTATDPVCAGSIQHAPLCADMPGEGAVAAE